MKLGLVTDSLAAMPLPEVLDTAARLGLECVELGCGNWSSAPHVQLGALLESDAARRELLAQVRDRGLAISALNCSGNPLHPGESGRAHDRVTRDTIRLAGMLGLERVVLMSGCPGGAPGDATSNWITTEWPPELRAVLRWQWEEVLIPYWRDLVATARRCGVRRLCLELHGHQAVYNVATLLRLRDAVGEAVGANLDPSHLLWMGADPVAAAGALGEAIHHVHAKDTRLDPGLAAVNGVIDTVPSDRFRERSWSYVTLGYGNGAAWWAGFCMALARAGYDDVLSIEHEDPTMSALEGVEKTVALLDGVALNRTRR